MPAVPPLVCRKRIRPAAMVEDEWVKRAAVGYRPVLDG
jgi:hypothetical protein